MVHLLLCTRWIDYVYLFVYATINENNMITPAINENSMMTLITSLINPQFNFLLHGFSTAGVFRSMGLLLYLVRATRFLF